MTAWAPCAASWGAQRVMCIASWGGDGPGAGVLKRRCWPPPRHVAARVHHPEGRTSASPCRMRCRSFRNGLGAAHKHGLLAGFLRNAGDRSFRLTLRLSWEIVDGNDTTRAPLSSVRGRLWRKERIDERNHQDCQRGGARGPGGRSYTFPFTQAAAKRSVSSAWWSGSRRHVLHGRLPGLGRSPPWRT